MKNETVVCYVLDNRPPSRSQCVTEVLYSCVSLRRHFSGKVVIYTNEIETMKRTNIFDEVLPLTSEKDKRGLVSIGLEKILAMESCLPNCIFLDTDTIILDDISLLMDNEDFDVAGVKAPYRGDFNNLSNLPMSERDKGLELNTGVVFVKGEGGRKFLSLWKEKQMDEINKPKLVSKQRIYDQISFMNAAKEMKDLNLLTLPWNYNYRDCKRYPMVTGKIYIQHFHHHQSGLDKRSILNYYNIVQRTLNGQIIT